MFFSRLVDPALSIVPARGGRSRLVTRETSGWLRRTSSETPTWSPAGRRITYQAYNEFKERNVLLVATVGGNRARVIARERFRLIDAMSWARDGRSVFYLADTPD